MITIDRKIVRKFILLCLVTGYFVQICHGQGSFDYREFEGNNDHGGIGILGGLGSRSRILRPIPSKKSKSNSFINVHIVNEL